MRLLPIFLPILALATPALSAPTAREPALVRVKIVTSDGAFIVAVDTRHAPKTTANFLAYVDDGRFDGTSFYRAARAQNDPKRGFVQGGIGTDARRVLPFLPHEPTSKTGLHHVDGTLSMARQEPGTATGNFSIMVGPNLGMDAHGSNPGYAAFGHVVSGMDVVKKMLAEPAGGGSGAMRGQMILTPVRFISATRLDGVARPTGGVKVWLIGGGK